MLLPDKRPSEEDRGFCAARVSRRRASRRRLRAPAGPENAVPERRRKGAAMRYCEKCGAYIPVGESACSACGYDPAEAEERAAEEARRQAAQEARRREAERHAAYEKAAREAELETARRRARSAEAEAQHWRARAQQAESRRQQGGAQYAYQEAPRTQSAAQGASQSWTPPWEEGAAGRYHANRVYYTPASMGKPKNKWISFVLCFLLGVTGAHKFYEGKIPLGLAYLFTGGFFGIGWIIDLIKILCIPDETYYV